MYNNYYAITESENLCLVVHDGQIVCTCMCDNIICTYMYVFCASSDHC